MATRRTWEATGWAVALGYSAWALWRLGDLPWLRIDWADPAGWLASVDVEIAAAAIARTGGLVAVGWVGLSSCAYAVGRMAGLRPSRLGWLSIGPIRRAVDTVLAGSLLVSSFSPAIAAESPPSIPAHSGPAAEQVDPAYVPVPAGDPEVSIPESPPPEPAKATPSAAPPEGDATVTVRHGDHLWGLAERHLRSALGRSPTDPETAPYWRRVVDANRDRLRSGDPDIVFPGEVVILPDVNRES